MLAREPELSVKELAQRTQIPASSVYRILRELLASGLAQRTAASRYGAGPVTVQLAARYRETALETSSVTPQLRVLAEQTGELAAFMVVHGTEAVCVETAETRRALRCSFSVGASQPLLRGATATALLSRMEESAREHVFDTYRLQQHERETITAAAMHARATGYAVSAGVLDEGIWGASAPVLDSDGALLGTVTLMAPTARASHRAAHLTQLACRTAGMLSGGMK